MPKMKINSCDLVCMDNYCTDYPLLVDLAYARDDNFLFGERIYRKSARLWLHKILAEIVLEASVIANERYGLALVLYDGLRTVEAQGRMLATKKVKNNPHWINKKPRLLSPPGGGAHPRAMAVDLSLYRVEAGGDNACYNPDLVLDMGTVFDYLAENPDADHNPAHRKYAHCSAVTNNRKKLDDVMIAAARKLKTPLFLLPQEWWDYRLPEEIYTRYSPLHDCDLPEETRLL